MTDLGDSELIILSAAQALTHCQPSTSSNVLKFETCHSRSRVRVATSFPFIPSGSLQVQKGIPSPCDLPFLDWRCRTSFLLRLIIQCCTTITTPNLHITITVPPQLVLVHATPRQETEKGKPNQPAKERKMCRTIRDRDPPDRGVPKTCKVGHAMPCRCRLSVPIHESRRSFHPSWATPHPPKGLIKVSFPPLVS